MRHQTTLFFTLLAIITLAGCEAQPTHTLPTATPAPTGVVPTTTATFLPPPTVTSYPTATPRGAGPVIAPPSDGATVSPDSSVVASAAPTTLPASATPIPPSSTPVPPAAPVKLPDGAILGDRIFVADFFQGWPDANFPTVKMTLKDGQYDFEIGPQDAGIRNTGVVQAHNLYHQIEVTPANCPDGAGIGLRFRQKDASNYYRFSVFCDNTYKSAVVIGGSVTELTAGPLPAGLDASTNQTHQIGVAAFNTGFTFYFDGKSVGNASDASLDQGDVAFYAFSQSAKVIELAFDNWQVWALR